LRDALMERMRMTGRAEEALGDGEKAQRWLQALGGARPKELLGTVEGIRRVERILGRIEHGIFS
jgi:uncharacterized protein (DUF2384 family)